MLALARGKFELALALARETKLNKKNGFSLIFLIERRFNGFIITKTRINTDFKIVNRVNPCF